MSMRRTAVATPLCLAALWLSSCSGGPPKMGTPEWYWSAAKEQFSAGDYTKTQAHLEELVGGESAFKPRAAAWNLVVMAGLARGYRELAEAYEAGGMATKNQSAAFLRTANEMQRSSRQYAIGLAERTPAFLKSTAGVDQYSLEFAFPAGSAAEAPALTNIRKGSMPLDGERLTAQRQTLARGLVLQTSAAVGAGEDAAKAAEMFKTSPVQVSRAVFLCGLAEGILQGSAIFDRKKLNEPDKKKILLQVAADSVAPAADSSDPELKKRAKDIQARIEKEQKGRG